MKGLHPVVWGVLVTLAGCAHLEDNHETRRYSLQHLDPQDAILLLENFSPEFEWDASFNAEGVLVLSADSEFLESFERVLVELDRPALRRFVELWVVDAPWVDEVGFYTHDALKGARVVLHQRWLLRNNEEVEVDLPLKPNALAVHVSSKADKPQIRLRRWERKPDSNPLAPLSGPRRAQEIVVSWSQEPALFGWPLDHLKQPGFAVMVDVSAPVQ